MRRDRDTRSERGDGGAMAVLLAIVLVAVALPVTGFAVTQVVRNGLQGELQRAADQGALSGSAMIPLADASSLKAFVASTPSGVGSTAGLIPSSWCTKGAAELGSAVTDPNAAGTCALDVACKAALTSINTDKSYGHAYATPYGTPSCSASYVDDSSFFTTLSNCANATAANLLSLAPGVPQSLTATLTPILGTLPGMPTGLVTTTSPLGLGSILPALLKPGVKVTMSEQQRGPLDALTPSDNGTSHLMSRTATAKRAFKNAVVVPTVGVSGSVTAALSLSLSLLGVAVPKTAVTIGTDASTDTLDLNPALANVANSIKSMITNLDTIVGTTLPACAGLVASLGSDLSDIVDPSSSGAPTAKQVLDDSIANASPLLAWVIPANVTSGLQIPFLDFVPVCMAQAGTVGYQYKSVRQSVSLPTPSALPSGISSIASCTVATPGIFRGRLSS